MRNTRNTCLLTHQGRTQCVKDWALEFGLHRNCLSKRLQRGWAVHKALTTPPQKRETKH
jgi:hypothetical protein